MTAWIILAFAFGLGMGFAFGILFTLYWQKRPLQNPFEPLEQQAKRSGWPEDEESDEESDEEKVGGPLDHPMVIPPRSPREKK